MSYRPLILMSFFLLLFRSSCTLKPTRGSILHACPGSPSPEPGSVRPQRRRPHVRSNLLDKLVRPLCLGACLQLAHLHAGIRQAPERRKRVMSVSKEVLWKHLTLCAFMDFFFFPSIIAWNSTPDGWRSSSTFQPSFCARSRSRA